MPLIEVSLLLPDTTAPTHFMFTFFLHSLHPMYSPWTDIQYSENRLLPTIVWAAKVREHDHESIASPLIQAVSIFLDIPLSSHLCHRTLILNAASPVRVKCSPDDTVGDLKKLIGAQTGTDPSKIQLKKWCVLDLPLIHISSTRSSHRYTIFKDHITLADYEIHDGMSLEMY